jgi:5-(carboxyamino)imidazole ribonucleotide synthase
LSGAAFPLPPGSTIGILGAGQLGRMLVLAAARLGFQTVVLSPDKNTPAGQVATRSLRGAYDSETALAELATAADVITYEFENVPAAAVRELEQLRAETAPGARALAVAQDRVSEKDFLREHGVGTVDYAPVDDVDTLVAALERLGAPALLKSRREGYDGKGQVWVAAASQAEAAFDAIGRKPAILEARAPFRRELSVIAARARDGTIASYPLGENVHEGGILRRTTAPSRVDTPTAAEASRVARSILDGLAYVGVIGVELFELEDGSLLVNEIAPRVHNTGHWTLDACEVDQFEQHIRAVAGWPLGPTAPFAGAVMDNLIGEEADRWAELAGDARARLWLYGKDEARPGRKMGHVTRLQPLP